MFCHYLSFSDRWGTTCLLSVAILQIPSPVTLLADGGCSSISGVYEGLITLKYIFQKQSFLSGFWEGSKCLF